MAYAKDVETKQFLPVQCLHQIILALSIDGQYLSVWVVFHHLVKNGDVCHAMTLIQLALSLHRETLLSKNHQLVCEQCRKEWNPKLIEIASLTVTRRIRSPEKPQWEIQGFELDSYEDLRMNVTQNLSEKNLYEVSYPLWNVGSTKHFQEDLKKLFLSFQP